MIRCKFKVESIELTENGEALKARAVYDDGPESENRKFWEFTPTGALEFQSVRDGSVSSRLKPGQEFYLDLTPVE